MADLDLSTFDKRATGPVQYLKVGDYFGRHDPVCPWCRQAIDGWYSVSDIHVLTCPHCGRQSLLSQAHPAGYRCSADECLTIGLLSPADLAYLEWQAHRSADARGLP